MNPYTNDYLQLCNHACALTDSSPPTRPMFAYIVSFQHGNHRIYCCDRTKSFRAVQTEYAKVGQYFLSGVISVLGHPWLRGTEVERRSLAGELSLSCARPAADG